ncbi:DeoR family transcriptional regulator [Paenibacillus baekrokdamisoli]|uniref:DeoR family transcriptional regulator n=1 Tax=Paenibacillus baekrokdamisoli TaxID=1712516 RepID=A0A3G9IMP6_9BACL|nr:DeoR/GlpR family DNA-binding transcription regulator [Paenibacillus baekrokdamisoli]MBB3067310.1 DeoR/GlpR family transcriptional regulator of sugar metabolism [Paenibacillus baekrokdamisoli]BBH19502.1 DeoR family transcriptional regulator [Paenibacillus baekrokdamisoli]
MSVLSIERKNFILDRLQAYGKVNAAELAKLIDVSMETIRRDLDMLEKEGLLRRVHGGAVKINYQLGEPPFFQRKNVSLESKKKVAQKAAQLVRDGDTIVIGGGTTILEMAHALRGVNKITILTNSVPTAHALMDSLNQGLFHGNVILLGGELNAEQYSTSGTVCEKMLDLFCVNKAFISPGGISFAGVMEYTLEESSISAKMIQVAKEKIILADHSKIGAEALCKFSQLDQINAIVCDHEAPQSWRSFLEHIDWITADEESIK